MARRREKVETVTNFFSWYTNLFVYPFGLCVYVCTCMHGQSCLTRCDPMNCSPAGSSVHGIFQARILEQVPISFSRGDRPDSGIKLASLVSSAFHWLADCLPLVPLGKPINVCVYIHTKYMTYLNIV